LLDYGPAVAALVSDSDFDATARLTGTTANRLRARIRRLHRVRHTMLATFDRLLLDINRWLVIALLAAMAVMVFANVALRFLTDHSILWADEASRYAMVWLTFIGAGLVLRYGGHIGIDSLQDAFPRFAPAIRAAIFTVLAAFFVVMLVVGIRYSALTWAQTTPVMEIPVGAVYLAMPIGFLLMLVHLALMARSYVARRDVLGDGEFDATTAKI
jgi:TRAP-type C4-dicarboxylate transport system permease small subunit